MYDKLFVKKRKRRVIAALVSLISAIGISSLVIVSFLGRFTGTFTVSLANSSVRLSLSDKLSFENPTSYLRIEKLDLFEENTYSNLPKDEELDTEETPYNYGAYTNDRNETVLQFMKYTFYLRNMGGKTAQYNLKVNLLDRNKASDGTERMLDDTLRVMVYENDVTESTGQTYHGVDIFAKEAAEYNKDREGNRTMREFVSSYPYGNQEDDNHPLATSFENSSVVHTYVRGGFLQGQTRRYTIVVWLEGEDPQSAFLDNAPVGASIKLGVEITAYENE
jgi:hypothetical protein